MRKVGMQGESGHRAPQLADNDPVRVRTPAFVPLRRRVPYCSDEKKQDENPGDRHAGSEIWRLCWPISFTQFGVVLSFVDRESGESPLHLFLRDTEDKTIPGPTQVWGKALGNESKLPFLRQVVVTCNPQRNFRTYGQGRAPAIGHVMKQPGGRFLN